MAFSNRFSLLIHIVIKWSVFIGGSATIVSLQSDLVAIMLSKMDWLFLELYVGIDLFVIDKLYGLIESLRNLASCLFKYLILKSPKIVTSRASEAA